VAAAGVALVAISGRSFWMDDAATALQTLPPTLGRWWQVLVQEKSAHLQMPLYMLYIWGYAKLFGTGEWCLRLANLPWFVAGMTAFLLAFPPGERRRPIAACGALFCPLAWYYLDEARPYAMLLGATLLTMGALARLSRGLQVAEAGDGVQAGLFLLGLVALSGGSLVGMIWAGAAAANLLVLLPRPRLLSLMKRQMPLWLAAGSLLLLLAGYYLWTLRIGARATTTVTASWGSTFFAGYELLGFSGLGPGRLEMRSVGLPALRPYWAWLALYGVTIVIVIGAALWQEMKCGNRRRWVAGLCWVGAAVFILGAGWRAHWRVLGRHLVPLLPVLLFLLTSGLTVLWSRRSAWAKGAALLFCILSAVSCLSLRFAPRHERDDYRAAAAWAQTALRNGQTVWWNAAVEGAQYYGVPFPVRPGTNGAVLLVANPTRESLDDLPVPQVVIASKPDLYDNQGALAKFLGERGFAPVERFTAFVIWEKNKH
jgi:hypothetical protein